MNDAPSSNTTVPSRPAPIGLSSALLTDLDIVADWGLLATDRDLKITFVNSWLERQTDRTADSLLGHSLLEIFASVTPDNQLNYYRQALEGRTAVLSQRLHNFLIPLPPPATQTRFEFMQQTCRIIPLIDAGEISGTLTIIEDVTERVAYETELRERVTALREADQHKDEFLAMLAHELRNPLAPISNAVQILRMSGLNNPMVEAARDVIERQVVHMVRLVDDLLDVSRVSRGKIQLQKLPIDLCAVARQAIETSRPLIDSHRHHFEVVLPNELVLVEGDFVRLAQLISNLLNNAAKYTDPEGQISLFVETSYGSDHRTEQAIVRVCDNGRGIDPSLRDRLFTLFYQADRNLDRSEGGLGIGLALVKSLADLHGGTIQAESPGRGLGSEFILRLPLLKNAMPMTLAKPDSSLTIQPLKFLVVDDNTDSAESMAQLLRADGHTVSTTYDAHKAIEIALQERSAVILLDLGLPELTGYEVCRILRQSGLSESCIIAMSGYASKQDDGVDEEAAFDAHFLKPVDYERLKNVLNEHFQSR